MSFNLTSIDPTNPRLGKALLELVLEFERTPNRGLLVDRFLDLLREIERSSGEEMTPLIAAVQELGDGLSPEVERLPRCCVECSAALIRVELFACESCGGMFDERTLDLCNEPPEPPVIPLHERDDNSWEVLRPCDGCQRYVSVAEETPKPTRCLDCVA